LGVSNPLIQLLLLPFSLLYGLVVSLRNAAYRFGVLRSSAFDVPVVSVGNLSVGGAGKTPHIEYLIRLLAPYLELATLSRGYGRKTTGYRLVSAEDSVEHVGDEPLQFKQKFADLTVAVGEQRAFAIPLMLREVPILQTILLDDAFQHRSVSPYLQILLTEHAHPFTRDWLLPSGRLREPRAGYRRADVIIVTKCPTEPMLESERTAWLHQLRPYPHQKVFFSYFSYGTPYGLLDRVAQWQLSLDTDVLLFCAIARADYLVEYLEKNVRRVRTMEFEDHRFFTPYDIGQAKAMFDNFSNPKKMILTTEKDATRLALHADYIRQQQLPIYVLPVEVQFHFGEHQLFDDWIKTRLLDFKI
jgi:tetraacyldisaccharide 4'-kinase